MDDQRRPMQRYDDKVCREGEEEEEAHAYLTEDKGPRPQLPELLRPIRLPLFDPSHVRATTGPEQQPVWMPRLIYGTAWKGDRTENLVYAALRAGFRAIDTAPGPWDYDEAAVGRGIRRALREGFVRRDELFVRTSPVFQPARQPSQLNRPLPPPKLLTRRSRRDFSPDTAATATATTRGLRCHSQSRPAPRWIVRYVASGPRPLTACCCTCRLRAPSPMPSPSGGRGLWSGRARWRRGGLWRRACRGGRAGWASAAAAAAASPPC